MNNLLLALGNYRFSINTAAYQTLARTSEYRWATQERLTQRPAKQFIGLGNETIELDGVIFPHYKGGLDQLEKMRAEAKKGKPLTLVDGLGNVWGLWVIESIEETQTELLNNGQPRKIEFRLSISHYGGSLWSTEPKKARP